MDRRITRAPCWRSWIALLLTLAATAACERRRPTAEVSAGVPISSSEQRSILRRIRSLVELAPGRAMAGPGLAGATGGICVRFLRGGSFGMRIPMPQAVDGQVPVCYGIVADPQAIASGFSLHRDRSGNDFVNAELSGSQGQEAVIVWSAVVLVAGRSLIANRTRPESYRAASACVQSGAAPVRELAARLWPAGGGLERYAGNIQRFIQGMEQRERTWSLDALGILKSGQGGICTANANLACALLRAQGIPCRSLAVIPPISRRLEMHRIVECFASGGWIRFDPSLLHVEIPLKPWQGIIMAKSGIADEEASMRPRIGAMPGCPFGQEAEIAQPGLSLHGSDFFWTVAVPLACFSVSGEAFDLAMKGWEGFVGSGVCAQAQIHAAGASDLAQFVAAMKGE